MAEALESVVSELEFEKQEEVTVEPEQNNRSEIHEEMIRLETERDIYKSLYINLLSDLSGGRLSLKRLKDTNVIFATRLQLDQKQY